MVEIKSLEDSISPLHSVGSFIQVMCALFILLSQMSFPEHSIYATAQ